MMAISFTCSLNWPNKGSELPLFRGVCRRKIPGGTLTKLWRVGAELKLVGLVPSWQARHNAFPKCETADPHKRVARRHSTACASEQCVATRRPRGVALQASALQAASSAQCETRSGPLQRSSLGMKCVCEKKLPVAGRRPPGQAFIDPRV